MFIGTKYNSTITCSTNFAHGSTFIRLIIIRNFGVIFFFWTENYISIGTMQILVPKKWNLKRRLFSLEPVSINVVKYLTYYLHIWWTVHLNTMNDLLYDKYGDET